MKVSVGDFTGSYDVKGWAREGLSQGWNLAQAGVGFGYWVLTEFQHIKQFNLLGDLYLPAEILSIGLSCLFTNDYAAANPFEWGPYGEFGTLGGEKRPWPWAQTGPLLGTPQSGGHGKCID